jgi:cell division septation protein DedD
MRMRSRRRVAAGCIAALLVCLGGGFSAAAAQSNGDKATADSVFARARQLVVNGQGAAGRLLIDSVLAATASESAVYGDALYWRGALAVTSSDAERDYRRLIVEYPLSAHVGDALLQLAQLENARGDRGAAITHLQRYLADVPSGDERSRAGLLLVRLLFDQNDLPRACTTLRRTMSEVSVQSVELRNQLAYYQPRCAAADVGPGGATPTPLPAVDSAPKTPRSARADSARAPAPAAASRGRYTLQVAAYTKRGEADALVKRLVARGLDARVDASAKVFRVRIGRYETHAAATAAQRELKAKKITAFVTEVAPNGR